MRRSPVPGATRLAAAAALVLLLAAIGMAIAVAIENFPRGLTVAACLTAALLAGWWALLRKGFARTLGASVAVMLVAGALALVVFEGRAGEDLVVVVAFFLSLAAARQAFKPRAELAEADPPKRAVLFYNPKSGGGKATRFKLADEARARGIEPVELGPGQDLRELVELAIAGGADALAMAGGDGSQAIVAAAASAHGLPYACIPSGTRNHFALDLGVDRNDVVGALDALVDGRERTVDLAEVNGRIFVNNVSLGVYAEAVQREGYREAKLRTIADTAPLVLGRDGGDSLDMHWAGPDGRQERAGAVLLVSNDPYRLGHAIGSGTRPRLDLGLLGMASVGRPNADGGGPIREWTAPTFEVSSDRSVAAGIDGEAVRLEPPLLFRARPAALRVRIARHHPGASPSSSIPAGSLGVARGLWLLAAGRQATD